MDALTLKVNLDCLRKDSQAIINAKVGEANGRKVVFTLYEGRTAFFVPAEATVIFRAQKPDGTILYNNCVIDDGKVEYTITSQTVAVAGVYACELQIVSDGRIIYSPYVTLNVMDNLYADTEVESSNEFTELENALNKIPSLEVINSKYTKPEGGIPKSDLAQDVQNSLSKANTALQEHQSLAAYRTAEAQDLIDSTKQDKLTAGENITITENGTISSAGGGAKAFFLNVFVITETEVVTNKTYAEIKAAIDAGDIICVKTVDDIVYTAQVAKTNTEIELLWVEEHSNRTLCWSAVVNSENAWSVTVHDLVNTDELAFELNYLGEHKVDKETGKGLSTNDYTAADKAKVEMISELSGNIGDLNDLTTEAKNNLVAAINEAAQTGSGGGSASISMRVDGGYIQYSTDNGKTWVNLIAEADIKGDKGDPGTPGKDGAPGVYYGTTQPAGDAHPVWIDPDGDHDDGGLLPAVTAADNGKVLRVVSGAWSPVDMPTGGTDMGITGATVGQIAKITAVDESGVPTAWSPVDMPEALPNPNALTFTGAVTGSYDGSAPMEVNIPQGGGGSGGGYSDYEVLIDETITTDEAGISAISYTELDFSQYNDIVIYFDRAKNAANTSGDQKVTIFMLGYRLFYNHSIANPADSYRSSLFRVLNMGGGNVASFASTANSQNYNPSHLYCCGIFPLNAPYDASRDNGFKMDLNMAYIGTISLKILAK